MATILLVEDDAVTRDHFARVLRAEEHCVMEASDGSEGLSKAAESIPDLMLLDLHLPLLDGLAVLERIRQDARLRAAPAVIITGDYMLDEAVLQRIDALHATVQYKPVWIDELTDVVNALLPRAPQTAAVSPSAAEPLPSRLPSPDRAPLHW